MKITLELQPEIERGLIAQAEARGISITDYAQAVLAREVGTRTGHSTDDSTLFDLLKPVRGLLTDEEIDCCFNRNRSGGRPVEVG